MKRFLLIIVAAAMAMVACQKQVTDPQYSIQDTGHGTYIYTLRASMEAPRSETKSDYDAQGHFSWSVGDAISVLFHKGDDNKFFTLTTNSTGNSVTFSGEITEGYEIGASDGDDTDKKIWALFPASDNHTYTEGSNPSFYVQPEVDFSATYFSANVPMYALNAAEGSLAFANLASTYKFIVKNIKDGVSKVQFQVYNQKTNGLSGSWPIHDDKYINYGYADPGSAKSTLTYVSDVTSNTAVFYVSCRYWGSFQPHITITNCATGVPIKTFVANVVKQPNYLDRIWPITLDVSEANGGSYYTPAIAVDGDLSDWDGIAALPSSSTSRIREWKFKSDDLYVYFYFNLRKNRSFTGKQLAIGFNTDNDTATGSNYDTDKILGNETIVTAAPFTNAEGTEPTLPNGYDTSSKATGASTYNGVVYVWGYDPGESLSSDNSNTYIELSIPKDKLGLPAAGSTITIGCAFDYYVTGTQSIVLE